MDAVEIPAKKNFKIGEVARLFGLEPYVLRYWETEFDRLKPRKTASGQRSYNRDDVELVSTIQHLLYTELYTIAGARRQLERAELLDLDLTADDHSEASQSDVDDALSRAESAEAQAAQAQERLSAIQSELEALEAELARLERENEELRGRSRVHRESLKDRAGRQRRVLLEVRRELQEVATAARAVA